MIKKIQLSENHTLSLSEKTKSHGSFPKKYADEYDSDINGLLEIIKRVNF